MHARLVEDCKLKCEESQRILLMQLSGLGAVALLQAQLAAESSSSGASPKSTAQSLARDRFLGEAARFYERGILVSEGNRRPVPMRGAEELRGAPRFRGGLVADAEGGEDGEGHCLALRWEASMPEGGAAAAAHAAVVVVDGNGAAKKGSGGGSTWAPGSDSPLWASVAFDTRRKVMGLRFWPLPGARLPGRCRVMACASPDGSVFVEVASFDLAQLTPDAAGMRVVTGFNIYGARTWKVEVLSLLPPTAAAAAANGGTVVVGARVECLAAEIEVDPLQLLHMTTNLRETLLLMDGPSLASASSSAAAVAVAEGEGEGEGLLDGADPNTVVMRYEDVRTLPMARRLAWLAERTAAVRRRESNLSRLIHRANRQHYLGAERVVEELVEEVHGVAARAGRAGMAWWEWTIGQLCLQREALDPSGEFDDGCVGDFVSSRTHVVLLTCLNMHATTGELFRRLSISPHRGDFPRFTEYNGLLFSLQGRLKARRKLQWVGYGAYVDTFTYPSVFTYKQDLAQTRKDLNKRLKALTDDPSDEEVGRYVCMYVPSHAGSCLFVLVVSVGSHDHTHRFNRCAPTACAASAARTGARRAPSAGSASWRACTGRMRRSSTPSGGRGTKVRCESATRRLCAGCHVLLR